MDMINDNHIKPKVWLVKSGEPLQTDSKINRLMRTGYLSEFLTDREASVTWWTSSFYHQKKSFRCLGSSRRILPNNIDIRLIESPGYMRNFSIQRWVDDVVLVKSLKSMATSEGRRVKRTLSENEEDE